MNQNSTVSTAARPSRSSAVEARQTVCGLEISVWALSTVDSREHTAIITAEMENRNAVWLTVTSGVTRQRSSQKETSTMAGRRELLLSPNTAQSAAQPMHSRVMHPAAMQAVRLGVRSFSHRDARHRNALGYSSAKSRK